MCTSQHVSTRENRRYHVSDDARTRHLIEFVPKKIKKKRDKKPKLFESLFKIQNLSIQTQRVKGGFFYLSTLHFARQKPRRADDDETH